MAQDKAGDISKGQTTPSPEGCGKELNFILNAMGNVGGFKERNHMAQSFTLVTWEQDGNETSSPVGRLLWWLKLDWGLQRKLDRSQWIKDMFWKQNQQGFQKDGRRYGISEMEESRMTPRF